MSPSPAHILVQAGGRGSRLRHHTWNKPKCLVSVQGKPMLYHLFERFKGGRFTVIGDYAFEQLEKYLAVNPPGVTYTLVRASGSGTCAGIAQALTGIEPDSPLVIVWSDLIVGELPAWPENDRPTICTTDASTCRWSVGEDGVEKIAIDPAYADLIDKETEWYRSDAALGFRRIPALLGEAPLVIKRIQCSIRINHFATAFRSPSSEAVCELSVDQPDWLMQLNQFFVVREPAPIEALT